MMVCVWICKQRIRPFAFMFHRLVKGGGRTSVRMRDAARPPGGSGDDKRSDG